MMQADTIVSAAEGARNSGRSAMTSRQGLRSEPPQDVVVSIEDDTNTDVCIAIDSEEASSGSQAQTHPSRSRERRSTSGSTSLPGTPQKTHREQAKSGTEENPSARNRIVGDDDVSPNADHLNASSNQSSRPGSRQGSPFRRVRVHPDKLVAGVIETDAGEDEIDGEASSKWGSRPNTRQGMDQASRPVSRDHTVVEVEPLDTKDSDEAELQAMMAALQPDNVVGISSADTGLLAQSKERLRLPYRQLIHRVGHRLDENEPMIPVSVARAQMARLVQQLNDMRQQHKALFAAQREKLKQLMRDRNQQLQAQLKVDHRPNEPEAAAETDRAYTGTKTSTAQGMEADGSAIPLQQQDDQPVTSDISTSQEQPPEAQAEETVNRPDQPKATDANVDHEIDNTKSPTSTTSRKKANKSQKRSRKDKNTPLQENLHHTTSSESDEISQQEPQPDSPAAQLHVATDNLSDLHARLRRAEAAAQSHQEDLRRLKQLQSKHEALEKQLAALSAQDRKGSVSTAGTAPALLAGSIAKSEHVHAATPAQDRITTEHSQESAHETRPHPVDADSLTAASHVDPASSDQGTQAALSIDQESAAPPDEPNLLSVASNARSSAASVSVRSELAEQPAISTSSAAETEQAIQCEILSADRFNSMQQQLEQQGLDLERSRAELAVAQQALASSSDTVPLPQFQDLERQHAELIAAKGEQDEKLSEQAARMKELQQETRSLTQERDGLKKQLAQTAKRLAEAEAAAAESLKALQEMESLKLQLKKLQKEKDHFAEAFNSERVLRKKYYNMVEDMKGKIRVYCRVRPLSTAERNRGNINAIQSDDEFSLAVTHKGKQREFHFDQVFLPDSSQEQVYQDTHRLIQSAVDGFNVCIFAYGQTGSGKTYTMIGDSNRPMKAPGLAPRAFEDVFAIMEANKHKYSFSVSAYMIELYCDRLIDLFSGPRMASEDDDGAKSGPASNNNEKLAIRKDKSGMVYVENSTIRQASSAEELYELFEYGSQNRHVASTNMNDESSRSHLVIGIIIESTNLSNGTVSRGKLSLVDLAGSERVSKTGATGQQLKEGSSINQSLSALGDVINALSTKQKFVPYRNNRLTELMQDSLGGNAKTLMFVNISPADYNSDETINSLNYASRVKLITNDAQKNQDNKEISRLKDIIRRLKAGESVDEEI